MADTLTCNDDMKLKNGSKGSDVTILQTMLKELGYYTTAADDGAYLKIDGSFGNYTEQAVRAFQKANPNLAVDGWVGPVTCKKLNERYLEKKGITTTTTTSSSIATTTAETKASRKSSQIRLYYSMNIQSRKYLTSYLGVYNLNLNGLKVISNSVTINTPTRKGQWSRTQLMDGTWDVYPSLDAQLKYTVEVTLRISEYENIKSALDTLQSYIINVKGEGINPGDYTMSITAVAYVKHSHMKITFELIEVDQLV